MKLLLKWTKKVNHAGGKLVIWKNKHIFIQDMAITCFVPILSIVINIDIFKCHFAVAISMYTFAKYLENLIFNLKFFIVQIF